MIHANSHRARCVSPGAALAALCLLLVTACSAPGPDHRPGDIFDPYEASNRINHEFNRGSDRSVARKISVGYAETVPEDLQMTVRNFARNTAEPSHFVNNIMQLNVEGAFLNLVRFAINSTLGFAGLADVAGDFGIARADTDFGQTMHFWGAPEGAYLELPVIGPTTERDAIGQVVDLFTNPLSTALPAPERYYGTGARLVSRLGDRGRFAGTVDSILHESADSYAQTRLMYIQSRRFELGDTGEADWDDPYDMGLFD